MPVYNIRDVLRKPPHTLPDGAIYVGREHPGVPFVMTHADGYLGNPFALKPGADGIERRANLERYRVWLDEECERNPAYREAVKALAGKPLYCWCAPEPCHGHILEEKALHLAAGDPGLAEVDAP